VACPFIPRPHEDAALRLEIDDAGRLAQADTLGSASSTRRIAFWKSIAPILNWTPVSGSRAVPSWAS